MGMFDFDPRFLIERENELMLRAETRAVSLPGEPPQKVEAYCLVWRWYDRLIAGERYMSEAELMTYVRRCMDETGDAIEAALPRVVSHMVEAFDAQGVDITSDDIVGMLAKRGMARWRERKAAR